MRLVLFWLGAVSVALGLLFCGMAGQLAKASPADAPKPAAAGGDGAKTDPKAVQPTAEVLAQRVWTITNLVLEHHLDPPTRQEMILAGAKALLKQAGSSAPQDLSRRISALTTEEQLKAVVRQVWSQASDKARASPEMLQAALLDGVFSCVPGKPLIFPVDDFKIQEQIAGNRYVGIGVQLAFNKEVNLAQLVTPLPRSPARRAGMKAGDLILQIDGKSTENVDLRQVVNLLRGEEGTSLTVVVRQPDSTEIRTLKMTRGVIPFETVVGYKRLTEESWQFRVDPEAPIAYVDVKAINSSTLHELRQVERQLQSEGFRAVVLDLRFIPGGHIQHAALLADGLLDGGLLWRVRDGQNRVKEYQADRDCLFRDWPLAVLVSEVTVNGTTELVTMALQDNGRAVVVGERTKGDGYSRAVFPLLDGQGLLLLRTGWLERPKPARDGWGVQPDHLVALNRHQRQAIVEWQTLNSRPERPAGTAEQAPEDPQLAKALEVLRAALKAKETAK